MQDWNCFPESLVLPESPLPLLTIAALGSILPQLGRAPRAGVATVVGPESSLVRMSERQRIRPPTSRQVPIHGFRESMALIRPLVRGGAGLCCSSYGQSDVRFCSGGAARAKSERRV